MNRLEHLKKTLIQNIEDNIDYPHLEFVLLNYDSKDNIDNWVSDKLSHYIELGVLNYYSTRGHTYFHRTHSANMAFRLAQGDILCKIDADNFIGKDFAFFLNRSFLKKKDNFISGQGSKYSTRDTFGKVCFMKKDFWAIEGYDESMSDYGGEDIDIAYRLQQIGRRKISIKNPDFLQSIKHDDTNRLENEKSYDKYHSFYIKYISPFRSQILVLFKDKLFLFGILIHSRAGRISLDKDWEKGNWELKNSLILTFVSGDCRKIQVNNEFFVTDFKLFNKISDVQLLKRLKLVIPMVTNRRKMQNNINMKIIKVNPMGFGKGKLTKNFHQIIHLNS